MEDDNSIDVETWRAKESGVSKNYVEKDGEEAKERAGLETLEQSQTTCQKQRELERVHCNLMGHRDQRE